MAKKAKERLAKEVAEKVLREIKAESPTPAETANNPTASRPLRKKLWSISESTITWGAITLLLLAVGSALSSSTLFILAWFLGTAALLKEDFFERKKPAWRAFGNATLCLILAVGLLTMWRTFPKPREIPTGKDVARNVLNALPDWVKSPNPPQSTVQVSPRGLSDPILQVEPENGSLWSTGPKQALGVFTVTLSNTGLEDVDKVEIEEHFFVAEHRTKDTLLKSLGTIPSSTPMLKGKQGRMPITLDFRPYTDTVRNVMTNFAGPSMLGVLVSTVFRRHEDGKSFRVMSAYGALNPTAPAIYTSNSRLDQSAGEPNGAMAVVSDGHNYFTDSVNAGVSNLALNRGRPSLADVIPYLDMSDHWVPVIKELSGGSVTREY